MFNEDEPEDGPAENGRNALDAWLLVGLPGRLEVARYLTSRYAAQYRLIVDVLLDAQDRSLTGVGHDDLLAGIRERLARRIDERTTERLTASEDFAFKSRMDALEDWGAVVRWQEAAKTEADFTRTRDRFQLTPEAAGLHRWVRSSTEAAMKSTTAATYAPAVISGRIEEFMDAAVAGDHQAAGQAWAQVRTTLRDMAESAAIWQSRMASSLAGAPTEEKMAALRDTLMSYINVWGAGIDVHSPRIRDRLGSLADLRPETWRAVALAGFPADVDEGKVRDEVLAHLETAATLRLWFAERAGQADMLRRQVRDAVIPFLRGSRALLSTGGAITRRTELLRVAEAVEGAPDDDAGWRVWAACLGLWSARHLPGVPPKPDETAGRTSFWNTPQVPVDQKLRERGPRTNRGRAKSIPNRRKARERIRAQAEQERVARLRAEEAFLARSGRVLSEWATEADTMAPLEGELFTGLLTAVMRSHPTADSVERVAYSRDGHFEVTALPVPDGLSRTAAVHSASGVYLCRNQKWTVRRL